MYYFLYQLRQLLKTAHFHIRSFYIYVFLAIYSIIGSALMWAIESELGPKPTNGTQSSCVGTRGYWATLYLMNTVYTTIGMKNIH